MSWDPQINIRLAYHATTCIDRNDDICLLTIKMNSSKLLMCHTEQIIEQKVDTPAKIPKQPIPIQPKPGQFRARTLLQSLYHTVGFCAES